ncbi:MAG TPA: hydantoinase/oxoprolinase family protein [Drouetiella sp.]
MSDENNIRKVRIGIDVGGTFTHAVALDAETLEVLGRAKVPTTHKASEGVAKGIIDSLTKLLETAGIKPEDVTFIAHSTTQATNALLEGDVAPVGIICLGSSSSNWLAKPSTNLGKIRLAPEKYLTTYYQFIDTKNGIEKTVIEQALDQLVAAGAKAIAVTQAFSVDDPSQETQVLEIARAKGLLATSGSEVSQLYGLKVRTRTAVINAAMLPKMIESADMTETSVRGAGIKAPVMIMRSDGGVMDIEAMRRRPILTMLSGPAAGVAAAMMFLRISDGIFLEVGGTSTDISAISNGKAQIRSGEVGEHKVYMRTLDVRTVGVAGGSMPRIDSNNIIDVGPRSAHIAGLGYVSFAENLTNPKIRTVQPKSDDPADYLAIADGDAEPTLCITPTCASNLLKLVPDQDCARGDDEKIKLAFGELSKHLNRPGEKLAEDMLKMAADKCIPVVKQLIKDHKLDPALVTLVGGGGGAAAIVPFVAKELNMPHSLASYADVISAIGVALALIRETVERQVINPTNDDILKIREEAHAAVQKMGADPASIEIHVEIDSRTNVIRATAYGATSMTENKDARKSLTEEEKTELVAQSMRVSKDTVKVAAQSKYFQIFGAEWTQSHFGGLIRNKMQALRIMDSAGSIRLQIQNGVVKQTTVNETESAISNIAEEHAVWGDAGKVIPDIMLLVGPKIVDLSGLLSVEHVNTLAKAELSDLPRNTDVIVLAKLG